MPRYTAAPHEDAWLVYTFAMEAQLAAYYEQELPAAGWVFEAHDGACRTYVIRTQVSETRLEIRQEQVLGAGIRRLDFDLSYLCG